MEFYLGPHEDCSPGDSTSESSETLLQRGGSEGQYKEGEEGQYKKVNIRSVCKILVKAEFSAIKHLLYKRFSASHQEPMSPRRDLVLF